MSGARFVRADLHVHTMLGPSERAPASEPTVENMVAAARSAGISILAVTDHNSVVNVEAALGLGGLDLLIVPGIEVTAVDGDVLALFAPADVDRLREFAGDPVLQMRVIGKDGARRSRRSVVDLIREIGTRGGIPILAHVDTTDGWLARASNASKSDVITEPHLAGFEITRHESAQIFSAGDPDALHQGLVRERRTNLGWRAPLARVMSSDAHSPEQVGVDVAYRTLTRLRVDTLDFAGVKAAIRVHPDSRCRIEADLEVQYPRLVRAVFEGGFLDQTTIEISSNLNCLIGGRGSGKSTALVAIQAVLDGSLEHEIDAQSNMPDRTTVEFVDPLGTIRRAVRERFQNSVEEGTASSVSLDFIGLEQNFGVELQSDPTEDPEAVHSFLSRFLPGDPEEAAEAELLAELEETARTLRQTTGAGTKLKGLGEEKDRLTRMLSTATDKNLTLVAEYAAVLATEKPLLAELERSLAEIPGAELPATPDLEALAEEYEVDLTHEPASKFVPGDEGLLAGLAKVGAELETREKANQEALAELIAPVTEVLAKWTAQHQAWEAEIARRSAELREAGFSMQIDQLAKIRVDLATVDADIRTYQESQRTYRATFRERQRLLTELKDLRDRRFKARRKASKKLTKLINAGSPTVTVTISWTREAIRAEFANLLGQLFGMHSPRKERFAAALTPQELAEIALANDGARLAAIGGTERFMPDASSALETLRTFDVLFQLETMDLPDLPEIRVRFDGDPPNQTRPLDELSLGQLRSVLLGFLLRSPGNAPLVLDQPEEQLDGAFVSGVVVPYLHSAKEQRQLLVATHNANIVVLGDAELVTPLRAAGTAATVVDPGSVDNLATQHQIVEILEGGREAFEQRATRYGLL